MDGPAAISSSPSSSSAVVDVGPSTSARSPEVMSEEEREEEDAGGGVEQVPEFVRRQTSTSASYRVVPMPPRRMEASTAPEDLAADDTLSCVIVILTFWFFVSMTLIMGIFGSEDLQIGPYSSILLKPNPLFVSSLKMESSEMKVAPVVYGFYKPPPLDVTKIWSWSLSTSVRPDTHKEWVHYLNEGSQINISYSVPSSSSLIIVIAKGIEGLAEWVEDPLYPDSALSWNVIRGNGTIRQDILKSYDYYVAIGNFNSEDVEVGVNLSIRSTVYDITGSYYMCNLTRRLCNFKILFPEGNQGVLTTPGPTEGAGNEVYVKLSYEPRWMTYFLGIGGMTSIMLWGFNCLNRIRRNNEDTLENQLRNVGPERAPLLPQKDDDLSSLGSSYDSGSQSGEEYQDLLEGPCDGRPGGEGGKKYQPRQLCVICYDAPKDCFFIPCGHCASCFDCGVRVAEVAGTCPICRRRMKKVRRIYNV
uniref:RING-type domain-containing protein n=1 Tax=Opuntia streptacantha TaxID=393608 RepID=A0A7C9EXS0_OPUST